MDIAKIRKKAKEKEEQLPDRTPPPAETAPEEQADERPQEEPDAVVSAAGSGQPKAQEPAPPSSEVSPSPEEEVEEIFELLTFSLGGEEFAFKVPEVEEIIRYQKITKVPTTADFVSGITSLRGKIIPVVDLKRRLKLDVTTYRPPSADLPAADAGDAEPGSDGDRAKILIVEGPKGVIGVNIDRVLGVIRVPVHEVLDPPAHLSDEELRYISGVVIMQKRFISIVRSDEAVDIEIG